MVNSPYRAPNYQALTVITLLSLFACFALMFVCGLFVGRIWASEDFYEKCAGGEVYIETGSRVKLEAVGCAEIARRVR